MKPHGASSNPGYSSTMEFHNPDRNSIRICLIGYSKLNKVFHSLLPDFRDQAHFTIIDSIFNDALKDARRLIEAKAVDVFISAGANANYLKDTLPVPVLPLRVSQSDLFVAAVKASAFSKKMLLLTHENQLQKVDVLSYFPDFELVHRTYSTVDDARDIFQKQKGEDFGVVIGSSFICELAEQARIPYVMVYSRESCRALLESAISRARIDRKWQEQEALAELLIREMETPVVLTNRQHKISSFNNEARLMFPGMETGKHLTPFIADLDMSALGSAPQRMRVDEQMVEVSRTDFALEEHLLGYLYHFKGQTKKVDALEKLEHKLTFVSSAMRSVSELTTLYANTPAPVLLQGETGTGKELIARQIHAQSSNRKGPFVAINCAAIPSELFESELFGYVEGAFTSANRGGRSGLLEEANGGTFFMDEVNELPLTQQAKLLRVLQERELKPVGSNRSIPLNIKLVAACHHDLQHEVAEGRFREDLFYRMNVFLIRLPALRERKEDIEPLIAYFLQTLNQQYQFAIDEQQLTRALTPVFVRYDWPGNVRQLENIVERILVSLSLYPDIDSLVQSISDVAPELNQINEVGAAESGLSGTLKTRELEDIYSALERFNGNKTKAADFLGISKTTLWRRLKQ